MLPEKVTGEEGHTPWQVVGPAGAPFVLGQVPLRGKCCALLHRRMCTFLELPGQAVWVGLLVEHHVGPVHTQAVLVRGRRVICWAEGAELVAPPCLVNKMVERA